MTPETWLWVIGILLGLLCFWLRDWKERMEIALASKQKKLDEQAADITVLKVEMEKRIRRDEFNDLRDEVKKDINDAVDRIIAVIGGGK